MLDRQVQPTEFISIVEGRNTKMEDPRLNDNDMTVIAMAELQQYSELKKSNKFMFVNQVRDRSGRMRLYFGV